MARLNPRLAAGAGVVSAVLLLGCPSAAVAPADRGDSSSDLGNGSHRDGGHGRGEIFRGEADEDNNGSGNGASRRGVDDAARDNDSTPKVRVGSGRDDRQWLGPGGSVANNGSATDNRSGATGQTGPSEQAGIDHPGAAGSGFPSPRVTFGNGRTPGVHGDGPEPNWQTPATQPEPAPAPPPPPPPPPAPPSSWVDRIATPSAPTKQLGVAPASDWGDPLWGIAGLLLVPATGAALGYRQARAARAVDRLRQP